MIFMIMKPLYEYDYADRAEAMAQKLKKGALRLFRVQGRLLK